MSASLVGSEMCIRDRPMCCPGSPVSSPRAWYATGCLRVAPGRRTALGIIRVHDSDASARR
eukprot:1911106-Alexandrium_andersonii.AAC.1